MNTQIVAKPTAYAGINFRSRLEARHAAMFDLLGFTWEYEPECEGKYIPDFVLHGEARDIFVEVKSAAEYYNNRAKIIKKAQNSLPQAAELLILTDEFPQNQVMGGVVYGMMPSEFGDDIDNIVAIEYGDELVVIHEIYNPNLNGTFDIGHSWGSWESRLSGLYKGDAHFRCLDANSFFKLWSRAGNIIQWMPS